MLLSHPVVADVGKPGVAGAPSDGVNEIVTGTGMYLLHAYNPAGVEPAGWPKLTGGWLAQPPALGDVDGDGLLEVAANTREGNVYVWDTDGAACGNNDQWWTYHHDEWNTGDHRRDTRAPDRVLSLAAIVHDALAGGRELDRAGRRRAVRPGGLVRDGVVREPRSRPRTSPRRIPCRCRPRRRRGAAESTSFAAPQNLIYVGLRARDEAGNPGRLSVVTVEVLPEPGPRRSAGRRALLAARARRAAVWKVEKA